MKAWVLHGANDMRYEEVDSPRPAADEVVVSVRAAGICGSDIPRIYQTGAHVHPLVPGHEFTGQVAETGRNVSADWLHRRVGIFPLIPCQNCPECQRQHYELCSSYSYLGSRRDGGFAEYVAVPAWNLVALPDEVSYIQAAMMEPMAVAVHAMRSALAGGADRSKSIAVCGLGTIGMLLVLFLMEAGYTKIYVMGNKEFQRSMAAAAGVPKEQVWQDKGMCAADWLMAQTKGAGVDVFFECVGRTETISDALLCTAPNGIVQLVGNPASDIGLDQNTYWQILRRQLTVKGSWNSSFTHHAEDDWQYVLDRLRRGRIQPQQCITHQFALGALEQGLLLMRDKAEPYMKVMQTGDLDK